MAIIEQEQPILEIVRELKKRLLGLRNDMEKFVGNMDKFVNPPDDVESDSKPTPYLSPLNEIVDALRCCHSIANDIQAEFDRDIKGKIAGHEPLRPDAGMGGRG